MFIETLLGMELFAYNIKFSSLEHPNYVVGKDEPGEYPRPNFNNLLNGFITIFIVFIGENWNEAMYDHTRAAGHGCIVYFMQLFIIGNIILLNLFLAILLGNFEDPPGKSDEELELEKETAMLAKTVKPVSYTAAIKQYLCFCVPNWCDSPDAVSAIQPQAIGTDKASPVNRKLAVRSQSMENQQLKALSDNQNTAIKSKKSVLIMPPGVEEVGADREDSASLNNENTNPFADVLKKTKIAEEANELIPQR